MNNDTYYLHIDDFGHAYQVRYREGHTLSDLQASVDGLIDIVVGELNGQVADFVVNDEGMFRDDFGINHVATAALGRIIAGPVTLSKTDDEGNTLGFTEYEIIKFGLEITGGIVAADKLTTIRDGFIALLGEDWKNEQIRPLV